MISPIHHVCDEYIKQHFMVDLGHPQPLKEELTKANMLGLGVELDMMVIEVTISELFFVNMFIVDRDNAPCTTLVIPLSVDDATHSVNRYRRPPGVVIEVPILLNNVLEQHSARSMIGYNQCSCNLVRTSLTEQTSLLTSVTAGIAVEADLHNTEHNSLQLLSSLLFRCVEPIPRHDMFGEDLRLSVHAGTRSMQYI